AHIAFQRKFADGINIPQRVKVYRPETKQGTLMFENGVQRCIRSVRTIFFEYLTGIYIETKDTAPVFIRYPEVVAQTLCYRTRIDTIGGRSKNLPGGVKCCFFTVVGVAGAVVGQTIHRN